MLHYSKKGQCDGNPQTITEPTIRISVKQKQDDRKCYLCGVD